MGFEREAYGEEQREQRGISSGIVDNRKLGMISLIGAESLFFASLIATFIIYKGQSVSGPQAADAISDVWRTVVATFILLTSSGTMALATEAHQRGEDGWTRFWLVVTILCGMAFLGNEANEFASAWHKGIHLQTNLFTQCYYTLVGFHGLHVFIGLAWLGVVLVASLMGRAPKSRPITMECVSIYWHFVDMVWVMVFIVVYLFKSVVPA
jgi:heme/copper-type cytochrome/quinol oxidase subunit 3